MQSRVRAFLGSNDAAGQSVHAPTQLFPSYKVYNWEIKSPVRSVHFGITHVRRVSRERADGQYKTGPYIKFEWSPGARAFAAAVTARKRRILADMHRPSTATWRESLASMRDWLRPG